MAYNILDDYSEEELKGINYNFVYLELLDKDVTYSISRGKRLERFWKKDDHIVIKEYYEYEFKVETDSKEREVTRMTKKVDFYDGDGDLIFTRVIKDVTDDFLLEGVNENIRKNRVKYLSSEFKKIKKLIPFMPTEPFDVQAHYTNLEATVEFIQEFYKNQQDLYIQFGGMIFENAINSETDPTALAHLSNMAILPGAEPKWPAGQTVKQALLHQLNGDV